MRSESARALEVQRVQKYEIPQVVVQSTRYTGIDFFLLSLVPILGTNLVPGIYTWYLVRTKRTPLPAHGRRSLLRESVQHERNMGTSRHDGYEVYTTSVGVT